MAESEIRRRMREIRESYYAAVRDWTGFDRELMISHLEQAINKTQNLIKFLRHEEV